VGRRLKIVRDSLGLIWFAASSRKLFCSGMGFFFVSFVSSCSKIGLQQSVEQKETKPPTPFLLSQPNDLLFAPVVPGKPGCFPQHSRPDRTSQLSFWAVTER